MGVEKFVPVSREEFYASVGQCNVSPRAEREKTFWEMPNRQVIGVSTPGYNHSDDWYARGRPKTFLIDPAYRRQEGAR